LGTVEVLLELLGFSVPDLGLFFLLLVVVVVLLVVLVVLCSVWGVVLVELLPEPETPELLPVIAP
jgi:hypothetical protein